MNINEFQLIINLCIEESEKKYSKYLLERLSPANLKQENWYSNDGSNILKQHVLKFNYQGKNFRNSDEVIQVYQQLLESILEEFNRKYMIFKAPLILILYSFKKINSLAIFSNFLKIYGLSIESENKFLRTLNYNLECYITENENSQKKFKEIEAFLGIEKIGIELLLEHIIDTPYPNKQDENQESIKNTFEELDELIIYVHEIGILASIVDNVKNHLLDCELQFNNEGLIMIYYPEERKTTLNQILESNVQWLQEKENDKYIVPINLIQRLNIVVKNRIGLNLEEINQFIQKLSNEKDCWRVLELPSLKSYILNHIQLESEDLKKLLDLLIRNPEEYSIKNYIDLYRDSRVMLKPIVPLAYNFYIFSDNVLLEALIFYKIRIFDVNFYSGALRGRFEQINNKINIDFEEKIRAKIENSRSDLKVKHNLTRISDTEITLPEQIDLIVVSSESIYVCDCKNFLLKTSPRAIRNEINNMLGKHSKKLSSKVNFVNDNLEIILEKEFGISDFEKYRNNIKSLFIVNNFSVASNMLEMKHPMINYTQIEEYFINAS
ncbi:hypothetical protein OEV98_04080 [Caldibacillus lycopersici]|uniref:NERD domain-containing protein n=1 Tax=Perspicuibacillus lycopersici TaxID=1325689 RepID=A0AAE3IQL2_9BACI|nr:hypothetical protein [Perspicuibacillus lycopersici]MCU9612743.1 hypothetical protein [Perspicuibacillus lycopersici]